MGEFNPPVPQQDNNWEIRVAVLLSLLFQVLLLFVGPMRKRSSSPVARFAMWSCYVLADWVADLALGLLLNSMGKIGGNGGGGSSLSRSSIGHGPGLKHGTGGGGANTMSVNSSSPTIFAFWTPFLLLHLGGQDTMTAYSIEDNELWLRHIIGLLFELFSAGVIFFCSLPGNPMIPASVLMFVAGTIKYGERTYSLYCGSVDGALSEIFGDPDPGPNYAMLMKAFGSKQKSGLPVEIVIADQRATRAKEAEDQEEQARHVYRSEVLKAYEFFLIYRRLCFDVNIGYKERKRGLAYFVESDSITPTWAFRVIGEELNFVYDMVHTKEAVAHTMGGCVLRFVGSGCIISALVIFCLLHKANIRRVDVGITYALLLGGLTLDLAAFASFLLFSHWTLIFLERACDCKHKWLAWIARAFRSMRPSRRPRRWKEEISQLNLLSYCLGKPYPYGGCKSLIMQKLGKVGAWQIFGDVFFVRREPLSQHGGEPLVLKFVFDCLRRRAEKAKKMVYEEMKKMCSYRGEGVLLDGDRGLSGEIRRKLQESQSAIQQDGDLPQEDKFDILVRSVRRDFDESLLIWHIATDLCSLHESDHSAENIMKPAAKALSEYMLYLLIKQPKMLLASAGIGLKPYKDTCAEARRFFMSSSDLSDHVDLRKKTLLSVNTCKKPSDVKGEWCKSKSVLFDAVILAKVLRELGADLMWEVVAEVWGEMLAYAASKAKGSTHVQLLSRGGELVTLVWFLMAHMGLGDVYKIDAETKQGLLVVYDK